MTDARQQIDSLRRRLDDGERGGSTRDREALLGMSDNLDLIPSEVGDYRHLSILREATIISESVDVDLIDALDDRNVAEEIVRWINRTHDNEHTNQDYRSSLRAFGRYAREITDDPPESLDWVPTGTSNDFNPVPSERDLLTYEGEIKPLLEAAQNPRDEALVALQFEAGLRGGELKDLRVGDIFEAEHTLAVHCDGKQGERTVHLVLATPFLNRWLAPDRHPAHDTDDAPLWTKLSEAERISDNMFYKIFRELADRASVSKTVTPTNLRKSNTRWLLRLGMKRGKIEQRQGRVHGSKHTARYEAEFGDESLERTYASLHGQDVEVDDSGLDVAPVACPRCSEATPKDLDYCIHCRAALDLEAKEVLDDVVETLEDEAIETDDPERRAELINGSRTLRNRPNLLDRDEIHELASSLSKD